MKTKKILLLLGIFTLLFSVSVSAKTLELTIGGCDVNVLENGSVITSQVEAPLFTEKDRTMVPVRIIAENFGCDVSWNEEEESITITNSKDTIILWLGRTTASVNGDVVFLDVAPVETNGRTFVPVRFISETLGYNVTYVPLTEQVLICNRPDIMISNGQKINYCLYEFIMTMNSINANYTAEEMKFLSESAYTTLNDLYINSSVAKANGVTYSKEIYDNYMKQMEDVLTKNPALAKTSLKGAFALYVEECMYSHAISDKVVAEATPDENELKEAYNNSYYAAKYIYMSGSTKNAKNQLEVLRTQNLIKDADSFDSLMASKSEDDFFEYYPNGYIYTDGDHEKLFIDTLKSLEINGISKVFELENDGFYIIKRVPLPELDEEFTYMVSDSVYNSREEAAIKKYFSNLIPSERLISPEEALKILGGTQ